MNSPALSTSTMSLLTENDDMEERKRRRKSKIMVQNTSSPGGPQPSPGRKVPGNKEK